MDVTGEQIEQARRGLLVTEVAQGLVNLIGRRLTEAEVERLKGFLESLGVDTGNGRGS